MLFIFAFIKRNALTEKLALLGRNPMLSWIYLTLLTLLLRMILIGNVAPLLVWLLNLAVLILTYVGILLSKKGN